MRSMKQYYTMHKQYVQKLKRISKRQKEMHVKNKHTNQTIKIKHNSQTKNKAQSTRSLQWCRHSTARVRYRGDHPSGSRLSG